MRIRTNSALPLLVTCATLASPAGAQFSFESAIHDSDVGLGSMGIAVADLDGDGDLDIATGLHALPSHGLGLWYQQTDGTFVREDFLELPARATEVRAGDLDHDGDADLVVSNFTPGNSVSVFTNLGGGQFVASEYHVTAIATGLELSDLNGDGFLDIAVSLRSIVDHSIGVLLNTGGGQYGAMSTYLVGIGPDDVGARDLDGDGDVDLVSVDTNQDTVSVLLNEGAGTFAAATAFPVGTSPRNVAIGDITGDGIPDLVVSNDLTAAVTCLHGDGTGGFPTRVDLPISLRGRDVTLADLDQDGALDIALGIGFIDHVLVLRSLGAGAFAPAQQFSTGYEPFSIVAADLDGDGDLDLATADDGVSGTPSMTVLENGIGDGPGSAYCFGSACPCGNDDPSAGCGTSSGTGALLSATGSASVSADDLVLTAAGVPANQNGVVFMGPATTSFPFADGLRCVAPGSAGLFRFPVRNAGPGGALHEGPGIVALSQGFPLAGRIQAGQTWHFQAWFRDPLGPCGTGAGLSSGYTVSFQP